MEPVPTTGQKAGSSLSIFVLRRQFICAEAEFLYVFVTKDLRFFLLASRYSQSPLLTDFIPPSPPPPSKSGLKLVCNVNIVYGNLMSENSQDYAQKPKRNCTFMNSASVHKPSSSLHTVVFRSIYVLFLSHASIYLCLYSLWSHVSEPLRSASLFIERTEMEITRNKNP